jgi:PAS domain S-box-containing protein
MLFEQTREIVLIVRPDGAIVSANPAAQAAYGLSADELLTMTVADLSDPALVDDLGNQLFRAKSADVCFVSKQRWRDGRIVPVEVNARCIEFAGDENLVCLIRDLDERRREELRDRALAAIVTTSDDAIVGKTLDGTITSWNPAAERLFGWTAEEMVGNSITRIVPEGRLGELKEILARLGRGERVDHHETVRRAKDGSLIEVSISVSPIVDSEGLVVGAAKIARNITERRRFERQQREFLLLAAHELRTPLTALKVSTQLLQRKGMSDEEVVGWILNRVNHLGHLVDDLVDAARFDSGPLLRLGPVDLTALASEIAADAQAHTDRHVVRVEATALPIVGVWDRARLEQVLANLLENALIYAPGGEITVRIDLRDGRARVVVTDQGPGIPREAVPALFQRFVRLESPGMNRVPGLGLGLYLCRMLVEAHHGRIWVEEAPGGGAAFVVELPLGEASDVS